MQYYNSKKSYVTQLTLKGEGNSHGGAGRGCPLLQLPLLEGVMRLSAALKGSRIVGVIHVVLLTWVYIIRFVCILVGGRT